jgi:hypothetical protein
MNSGMDWLLNLACEFFSQVQQKWYLREGVTPLGIATVLVHCFSPSSPASLLVYCSR